ncbi:MAG: GDSL-type esterase/lipase family protein [Pseudomonadota bacterium]
MQKLTITSAIVALIVCINSTSLVRAEQRWAHELSEFAAEDRTQTLSPQIAFLGSSSIARWHSLHDDMAPRAVYRRGLSGARIGDILERFGELIGDNRPRIVVMFAGSNDIVPGSIDVEAVVTGVEIIYNKVRRLGPAAQFVFIAITPTPHRRAVINHVLTANSRVRAWAEKTSHAWYLDAAHHFLTKDGRPNRAFFLDDGLHLNRDGYAIWTSLLRALLADLDTRERS